MFMLKNINDPKMNEANFLARLCPFKAVAPKYSPSDDSIIFTERRNAPIASALPATAIPSVCPSVCLSATRQYCVKTTACSTVQFAPSDSKMCLVLQKPKILQGTTPYPGNFGSK